MGSQEGGSTATPPIDWAMAGLLFVGACLAAAGIILASLVLGILGAVLMVGGVVGAMVIGMFNHVEEYHRRREDTE